MTRSFLIVVTTIACTHGTPVVAIETASLRQDPNLARDLEAIGTTAHLPALAAAVWRDGHLLEIAAVGDRRSDATTPVGVTDRWHLGSNTKAMTATLVGILVDRGVIHWDDALATLLPEAAIDPAWASVTVDELLHHQSGAAEEPPETIWHQLVVDGTAATRARGSLPRSSRPRLAVFGARLLTRTPTT